MVRRFPSLISFMLCVVASALIGCSASPDLGGAANTAGETAAGAADTVGQAAFGTLATTGEATAAVTRGVGEAATEATGGEAGATKSVQGVADEIAKPRNVDFMGNDVEINPSEDKKIRMEF